MSLIKNERLLFRLCMAMGTGTLCGLAALGVLVRGGDFQPLELTRIGYDRGSESVFGGTPKK
eukprot:CAMPEP_0181217982 /NCGR_PEP_ID=MMETSP1096-20121128/27444_1 /TAXON_ID=156174 ORGANISM="Chrysochromulina ericina, Strain CCMP281" /NCGR_SAMPLE_ID=MMETSP1096 /ASSEMBLY_ACC=CAM_ASM_000453 /LENGTH=61 /DNA_ID=CAMNT_0023310155 /DNA_START=18 /DNA_END=203 /DNA_ORIENTATION=-